MSDRLKFNLITTGIVLGLFVLLLIALLFYPVRSRDAVQVSFLGYTNDAVTGKCALFVVTNTSNEEVIFMPCEAQMQMPIYSLSLQPKPYGLAQILRGHMATNFTAIATTNDGEWKQPVFWFYGRRSEFEFVQVNVKDNLRLNWALLSHGIMPRYYDSASGLRHNSFSETITNK